MILADFKLHPLKGSKFFFRIRIFDTQRNMEQAAIAEGSMTGNAQACFCGAERADLIPQKGYAGDVYLFDSPSIWADAVHELTHAAVHHVREIRGGDLNEPNKGEYASEAEEMLCRAMEKMVVDLFVELARFKNGAPGPDRAAQHARLLKILRRPLPCPDPRAGTGT